MNKKQVIAIVGAAGQQGQEYYKILQGHEDVKVLVDSDFEKLQKIYNKNPELQLFSSVDEAICKSNFSGAIICVPHHLHSSISLSLLKHQKIIIKEKPLALKSQDVSLYRTFPKSVMYTIVQRQFNPVFKNAKDDLKLIGSIYSYKYEYYLNLPEITTGWRANFASSGGGVLLDMGYHILDVALSFFGVPNKVTGELTYGYEEMQKIQLEDGALLMLSHYNSQIQGSILLHRHYAQKKEVFEILGREGVMVVTPAGYKVYDRKNQLIKEYSLEATYPIKRTMLQSYLQQHSDRQIVQSHFDHHASIVSIIEQVYEISRN